MADRLKKNESLLALQRAQREADGKKAAAEYEQEAIALRARTEKLRALRLAKEEADRAAAPPKPAAKKKTSRKAEAPAGTLSDWMKDQKDTGRNH